MDDTLKNAKEILDEFFNNIENIEVANKDISITIRKMYQDNKLTNINLINKLESLRNAENNNEN